ncbi:uncharacterized protein LOC136077029 [Hydra vulgaris]|uniref:Uncharacterized protein LOC136077029 n=1 Tax=Hydra vulgaris TaxID=6087 RepID=A0ABM4BEP0_HYDVU
MINMNHFEKWELESDLKAAKSKSASEKSTATGFGIGIAAQLGVRKKSVDDKKVNLTNLKRNKHEIINAELSMSSDKNISKTIDKKRIKLNSQGNIPYKVSSLVELNKRKNPQSVVKELNEKHNRMTQSHSIKQQEKFSSWNIKNTEINKNIENKVNNRMVTKNEIDFKNIKTAEKSSSNTKSESKSTENFKKTGLNIKSMSKTDLNQTNHFESNLFIKELSSPKKSINSPSFTFKPATNNAASQTESSDSLLIMNNKLDLKVKFKVVLHHDRILNRQLNELFSSKGESLSNFFTKIINDMSARRRSVESINDKCFISLNSRFAAFITMDLSKLELIPEEESTNDCEPVRIYTVIDHKNYQFHIKNNYLLPDILVTRLYPR